MKAYGRNILIRKVAKPKTTDHGIHIPDAVGIEYSYGKVQSVGKEAEGISPDDIVVFDPTGVREIELDPMRDSDLIVADVSMIFCIMSEQELLERKLKLP